MAIRREHCLPGPGSAGRGRRRSGAVAAAGDRRGGNGVPAGLAQPGGVPRWWTCADLPGRRGGSPSPGSGPASARPSARCVLAARLAGGRGQRVQQAERGDRSGRPLVPVVPDTSPVQSQAGPQIQVELCVVELRPRPARAGRRRARGCRTGRSGRRGSCLRRGSCGRGAGPPDQHVG